MLQSQEFLLRLSTTVFSPSGDSDGDGEGGGGVTPTEFITINPTETPQLTSGTAIDDSITVYNDNISYKLVES